ncbi:EAL domain-containing protein [Gallaecimonas pentaromativorans]|uniref:bifunctional diguanylate cyclase/phosphodiesterase n=1 Tax=Gallaecimonas pentaromativorans TaxID=584787 RepID=UPI003A8ED84B
MNNGEARLLVAPPDPVLLTALLEAVPQATACISPNGQLHCANSAFLRLLGHKAPLNHDNINTLLDSLTPQRWQKLVAQAQHCGTLCSQEQKHDGRHFALALRRIDQWHGQFLSLSLKELDNPIAQYQIQQLQNEILRSVAEGNPLHRTMDILCRRAEALAPEAICSVMLVDENGLLQPCAAPSLNSSYYDHFINLPIGPGSGSSGTAAWRKTTVEVQDIASDPLWDNYRHLALPLGLVACWACPVSLKNGKVVGTFSLYFRDKRGPSAFHRQMVESCLNVSALAIEHNRVQRQLENLIFFDPLTGLPNRTLLRDRIDQELGACQRSHSHLAAIHIDLDNFKAVNESLGQQIGDQLLQALAARMQQCLPARSTLARLGGDEFVLLVPDCDQHQARALAEQLQHCIHQPVAIDGRELVICAGIGISLAPEDASTVDNLLRSSESALLQAKQQGLGGLSFYRSTMNQAAIRRHHHLEALRRALNGQSLKVHYQPQIDFGGKRLAGLEVLARCQDPELGFIPPDVFIPLAEESGLIGQLDQLVMEQALAQLALWRNQGFAIPLVAVNLSAVDFRQPGLLERIKKSLAAHRLDGCSLTLEITESLLIESNEDILATMTALRQLGIGLSIDDFGTGYSSLSYLKRFPVTELKMDRSFIRDIDTDPNDKNLTAAVIQLAGSFQLKVVAEGVENQAQCDIVTGLGCDLIQGYHFARPMAAADLENWMTGQGAAFVSRH